MAHILYNKKSGKRFLDAYEDGDQTNKKVVGGYAVVTRPAQGDASQKWVLKATGDGSYTIQQKCNMRFLDAFEDDLNDYACVTRPKQNNSSQKWVLTAAGGAYTVQQKINMRFLDAYEDEPRDYLVVTREAQGDNSQKWVITATDNGPPPKKPRKSKFEPKYDFTLTFLNGTKKKLSDMFDGKPLMIYQYQAF